MGGAGEDTKQAVQSKQADVGVAPAPAVEAAKPAAVTEDVPDPDEDDLDDLDGEKTMAIQRYTLRGEFTKREIIDMLDDFSAVKLEGSAKKPLSPTNATAPESVPKGTTSAPKDSATDEEEPFSEEEFAKQLQAGMAGLLGELDKSVCVTSLLTCISNMLEVLGKKKKFTNSSSLA